VRRIINTTTKAVPLALAGMLALAACGDDGGSETGSGSDEAAYVDAIAATADEETFAGQGRCVAQAFVDAIGFDELSSAVTPEEIRANPDANFDDFGIEVSEDGAQALYDGMTGCMDVRQALIDSMAGEQDISPEAQDCLAQGFDDALLRDAIVATFTGGADAIEQDAELASRFMQAIAPCVQIDATAG
jgi:hypothetical protein